MSDNRMLDFFNENDLDEKDLNDREDAGGEPETESEDVEYAFCLACLNF